MCTVLNNIVETIVNKKLVIQTEKKSKLTFFPIFVLGYWGVNQVCMARQESQQNKLNHTEVIWQNVLYSVVLD